MALSISLGSIDVGSGSGGPSTARFARRNTRLGPPTSQEAGARGDAGGLGRVAPDLRRDVDRGPRGRLEALELVGQRLARR